jgi:hypothetical protein
MKKNQRSKISCQDLIRVETFKQIFTYAKNVKKNKPLQN